MVAGSSRLLRALVALGAVVGTTLALAGPAGAASPNVVISQVFGGGGNTGAPYQNDFVELFNRGSSPVSLAGWSVQYTSATGTGTFASQPIATLTGVLQPGQYYLVQEGAGAGNGAPLPVPDASSTAAMAAGAGKVIVANTTTGLACNGGAASSSPCSAAQLAQIVDLAGYGNANFFEGAAAAPTLSNTTSASRAGGGCTDTDQNGADFAAGTVSPRNTLTAAHFCSTDAAPTVSSTTPASGASGVAVESNVSLTFSEPVNVTGSWYSISCGTSGAHTATASGGPTTFTLDPDANFANGETCTVTVVAANVSDQDTSDPPDTMAADYVFSFTTVAAPRLAISQVYGGGGNTGATYTNDFIEVFNRGTSAVSLNGWSVQYTSATGTTWQVTNLSNVSLQPGQYYLVQEAAGSGGTTPLPTPDATGSIAMAAAAGKVALVNTTTALSGSCPTGASIFDLVGFGTTASCFEGTGPAPAPSNTTADLRNGAGCTDTNDNAADFTTGAPAPRNTASPLHDCSADTAPSVASTNPANGAAGVPVGSNVAITFSEPVNVTGSWYSISCGSSGTHTATVSGGPTTFTLDPAADFTQGETCTVTVVAANVSDQDTNDPPDTMAADYVFSFTAETPATPIHNIQGATHISPLNGTTVRTNGTVVAKTTNGFWMQDPTPDADEATSEGIFVFTSAAPTVAVGDAVSVSARVQEFRPGGASNGNLTTTELTSPSISVLSTGNPLPAPTVIGTGGRIPPDTVIEDDASGNVETSGVFDPAQDGLDFYESLEGMRVQLNDAVAVGPTATAFGETPVVGDNGANASVRTYRGGVLLRANDGNPERITLDDLTPVQNANVGDHYYGAIVGVMDYNFGNPFLEVTSAPAVTHDGVTREVTDPTPVGQLALSTFNFENLAATDPQSKFDALADLIVNNLRSPDMLAGEEVQDNNGTTDNGVVDANVTLQRLVDAITAHGGPTYQWRQINPVNDQDGGAPGGNIRQAILFRTDRGLSFVDRPGGDSTTPNAVVGTGAATQLQFSPGRIAPADSAWNSSRKPLAAELSYHGHKLYVIVNHFNSKGGDDPLRGRFQPPVASSETQRHQQATLVANFVSQISSADPSAEVVVLGDLNDFEFSQTVQILEGAGLHDLMGTLPLNQRYSYEFEGNAQVLDHMLFSGPLFARSFVFDPVHVNAEFFDQASDHDPSVARVAFNEPPTVSAGGPYSVNEGSSVTLTATGSDPEGGALTYAWDLDDNGSFETPGQSVGFSRDDGPAAPVVHVRATDDAGQAAVDNATVTVLNVAPTATFNAPPSDFAGYPFTLSLTSPHDPSSADTGAGFQYAFDCGSGYGAFGSSSSASCSTDDTGSRVVHGKIRDKDGDSTEYTATVDVTVTFQSLCNLTRSYSSKVMLANRLCELLASAEADANSGAPQPKPKNPPRKPANKWLNRYVDQVNNASGDAFTATERATLSRLAQRLDDKYFPPAGSARSIERSRRLILRIR
jgi:uncharacterized protein